MSANPYAPVPCWRVFHSGSGLNAPIWSALSSRTFTKRYMGGEWAEYDAMFVFTDENTARAAAQKMFGRGRFEVWECVAEVRTSGGRYRQRYMRDQALYPLRAGTVCSLARATPTFHAHWLRWTWYVIDTLPGVDTADDLRLWKGGGLDHTMLCDRLMPRTLITSITTDR